MLLKNDNNVEEYEFSNTGNNLFRLDSLSTSYFPWSRFLRSCAL